MLCKTLGLSPRHIAKLGEQGAIQREKNGEGTWIYNAEEAAHFAPRASDETDYIEVLTSALKVAQGHAVETFKAVHEPAAELLRFYKHELGEARTRITNLEKTHDELVKAREDALNQSHTRELERKIAEAKQARWDQAFNTLSTVAPPLLNQFLETLLVYKSGAAGTLLGKLLATCSKDELEQMAAAGSISDDERAILQQAIEALEQMKEKNGAGTA